MSKFTAFTSALLLTTTPSLLVYPQEPYVEITTTPEDQIRTARDYTSYDDILQLIAEIESGELENKCTPEEVEKIKHFIAFLAKQGQLPDNSEESLSLDDDIDALLNDEESTYEDMFSFASPHEYQYMVVPAVLYGHRDTVLCKSWIKKQCKNVGKFVKKHKKALIVGVVVVVAVVVVVVAVVVPPAAPAATSAAAAAAAAASSDSDHKSDKKDNASIPATVPPAMAATQEAPLLKAAIDYQITSFKENIVQNQFFQSQNPATSLSWEENGRALGSLFAHDSYNNLQQQIPYYPRLAREINEINTKYTSLAPQGNQNVAIGHPEIDRKFATDYSYFYANPRQDVDFNTLSHQVRGESALAHGYYNQAVQDLGKVIEMNPSNPLPYLERGIAHFGLGQYDRSLEDYQQFTAQTQKTTPHSISEFSLGFAKGLPKGVYESGEGFLLFMADFVKHPVQTSGQIVDSVTTLVDLVRKDEWGVVAEALSPEVHQLVTQWDALPSDKRGELAGYAVGKHGADILVPGALVKVASKSVKSAQELAAVCKNIQIAQETLLLETAAEIGNGAKIAEIVETGQKTAFFAEELGITATEMGQLKQAGKLEAAIDNAFETLINKSLSEAYLSAKNGGRHADLIPKFSEKPIKEIEKSIRSYEKLIAEHKDKIANPSKYCPEWDTMDPRRRDALINKRWPAEIQCYTEQKDILKTILDQRQ